jgi:hypothetical protein
MQWLAPVTPTTQEAETRFIMARVSKIHPISTNKLGMLGCVCYPSYVRSINRRMADQASQEKM